VARAADGLRERRGAVEALVAACEHQRAPLHAGGDQRGVGAVDVEQLAHQPADPGHVRGALERRDDHGSAGDLRHARGLVQPVAEVELVGREHVVGEAAHELQAAALG